MKYWMVWWFNSSEKLKPEDCLMGVHTTLESAVALVVRINSGLDDMGSRLSGDRIYIKEETVDSEGATK
tara:strand:+ start:304 stop:510 length:207 start_codon:yes stop_codon:yes gene_type:complete